MSTKYSMRLSPLTRDQYIISALLEIERQAANQGVEVMLSERGSYISVQWIKRHTCEKGAGAQVMKQICRYADDIGRVIMLSVIDAPSLEEYYRQFGFEGIPDPDCPEEVEMTRTPK